MFRNLFAVIGFIVVAQHGFVFMKKCWKISVDLETNERLRAAGVAADVRSTPP